MYSSKVDKPLFDWMTTITYRISTIDHIYRIHFHKSEKKVKRMNFNDEHVTSKHRVALTDFSDTACRIVFRSVNLTSSVLPMKFLENIDLTNYRSCSFAITTVCTKVDS